MILQARCIYNLLYMTEQHLIIPPQATGTSGPLNTHRCLRCNPHAKRQYSRYHWFHYCGTYHSCIYNINLIDLIFHIFFKQTCCYITRSAYRWVLCCIVESFIYTIISFSEIVFSDLTTTYSSYVLRGSFMICSAISEHYGYMLLRDLYPQL